MKNVILSLLFSLFLFPKTHHTTVEMTDSLDIEIWILKQEIESTALEIQEIIRELKENEENK